MSAHEAEEGMLAEDESTDWLEEIANKTEAKKEAFLNDKGPQFDLSSLRLVIVVAAISISNFSTALDSGFSAATHVAVASAFNHTNLASWPVNAFVITSMTFQPLYGRTSDHIGRKIPYMIASGLFATGILLSAFAPDWKCLIGARAICGLGAAGVSTMGSVVLTDAVGVEKRGYYQSMNYTIYGAGSALGSSLGGALVQEFGWRWVYKAQIFTSMTALVLLVLFIPTKAKFQRELAAIKYDQPTGILGDFDWRGSILLVLTLISLFMFLTTGGNVYPWNHPFVMLAGMFTAFFGSMFGYVEKRVPRPILPLYLFFSFPTRNIMATGFLSSMVNYIILYNIPMFFQTVHLDSIRRAGFRLFIPSITFTITSALTGSIIARLKSPALTLRTSEVFLCAGTTGLFVMAAIFHSHDVANWVYNMMLIAPIIGVGMIAPSTVLALLNITTREDQAVANSGLIMTRSLGVFVATALSATIVQNTFRANLAGEEYGPATERIIEEVRQNATRILTLEESLKTSVVDAYAASFSAVFGLCALSAFFVVVALSRVHVGGFTDGAGEEDKEKFVAGDEEDEFELEELVVVDDETERLGMPQKILDERKSASRKSSMVHYGDRFATRSFSIGSIGERFVAREDSMVSVEDRREENLACPLSP